MYHNRLSPAPYSPSSLLEESNESGRFAYVTLFSHDNYLPGVLALHRSVQQVGMRHPLLIMVTAGVSPEALDSVREEGCHVRQVESFHPETVDKSHYVRALYAECWNKLRMWEWEGEFDRLVYLDADMIVLQNLDHLFTLPPAPLYAVGDCYGGRKDDDERDACCYFTHECPEYFNAGFYVMQPDLEELESMKRVLAAETNIGKWRFAEQDFLNIYFSRRWKHLPFVYNAQKRIKVHHPDLWDLSAIHVIHYVDDKPWSHRTSEENLQYIEEVELWWKVYEQGGKKEKKEEHEKEKEKVHYRKKAGGAGLLDMPRMQMAAVAAALSENSKWRSEV